MGKYRNLGMHLSRLGKSQVQLSFGEVEKILGFPLPNSAIKYRPWWANDKTHTQAKDGWLHFGYGVAMVDFQRKTITFKKIEKPDIRFSKMAKYRSFVRKFEDTSADLLSKYFKTDLLNRQKLNINWRFDFVSADGSIVGEGKCYASMGGIGAQRFDSISRTVWMLEKVDAKTKFIVFGKDRKVPIEWLKRYGELVEGIDFYFVDVEKRNLELLSTDNLEPMEIELDIESDI